MAQGVEWKLTDNRKAECISMLKQRYTIDSIAIHFDKSPSTIHKKLSEAGINNESIRMFGLDDMRGNAYNEAMDGSFNDKMKFLDKYDIAGDAGSDTPEEDNSIELVTTEVTARMKRFNAQ